MIDVDVAVVRKGLLWIATGIDLDHEAHGQSEDMALARFRKDLRDKVDRHMKKHGHLNGILRETGAESFRQSLLDSNPDVSFLSLPVDECGGYPLLEILVYKMMRRVS